MMHLNTSADLRLYSLILKYVKREIWLYNRLLLKGVWFMKIGSLYGISAPMLVLFANEIPSFDLGRLISPVCNAVDASVILEEQAELRCFKSTLDSLPMTYTTMSDTAWIQQNSDLWIGKLKTSSSDENTIKRVKRELVLAVALQLFRAKSVPKSIYEADNLHASVNELVSKYLLQYNVKVGKLKTDASLIVSDEIDASEAVKNNEAFRERVQCEFSLKKEIDTRALKLTDDEAKVIQYFKDNEEVIDTLIAQLQISSFQEEQFFGSSFFDIVNRKPTSLLYQIIRKFDQIKTKQGSRFFNRVYDDVLKDFQGFTKTFYEKVSVNFPISHEIVLTPTKAMEIERRFPASHSEFFKQLFQSELSYDDLTVESYQILNEILDMVSTADYKFLNLAFAVSFSDDEWDALFRKLCTCGVGGLNVSGAQLFHDSLVTVSFCGITNIQKSKEIFDDFEKNIDLIKELLESMIIPIGGDVGERTASV